MAETRGESNGLIDAAHIGRNITLTELKEIAERAYIYAYPLVLLQDTRGPAPVNVLNHVRVFPPAGFRLIVRPNADTLYSMAWIDVSQEPVLIHVPDSGGRFYLLQFMDAWTETFANPGKRTTGTGEARFAITGRNWRGKLPEHAIRLDTPTDFVWLLGRTQTNGVDDYGKVHVFQNGMRLAPMSMYSEQEQDMFDAPAYRPPSGTPPPERVKSMKPIEFFAAFAEAMKANPPHQTDSSMEQALARIGLIPGENFDTSWLSADQLGALNEGAGAAAARIEALVTYSKVMKKSWTAFQTEIGRYGTNYMARAATARLGLGANPPEDAVYFTSSADSSEEALNGIFQYRMHFEKSNLPPVKAFWSITAYDKDGYFIANLINRYAIGDRDPLKFNANGSLDLYIQDQDPGADKTSNWLPSADDLFNLTIRLYWPQDSILDGTWKPPVIERVL